VRQGTHSLTDVIASAHAIVVDDLVKRFDTVTALGGVSFAVTSGSTTALLGGNGAGKTTTLSILLGLLTPTSGSVTVLGADMLRDRYRVLGEMNFSSPYVDLPRRLTVSENLNVYAHLYGVRAAGRRILELARDLDLEEFLRRPTGSLSAGQRTRVALAKALLNRPRLLLLDEPTASLDPDTGDVVRRYLEQYRKESGATIVLASHNMAEVERLCDYVLMMRAGRIVDRGAPRQLISRYGRRTMEEVFLDIARSGAAAGVRAAKAGAS
jgi:ABC-2 type transport system ATP-binding protein